MSKAQPGVPEPPRPARGRDRPAAAPAPAATGRTAPDRRRRRLRWGLRLAVIGLATGYVTLVGFDRFFYYPDDVTYTTPAELRVAAEDVTFRTSDGQTLHGWFLPAEGQPRGVVVHFHGNAANISNHLPLVSWLPQRGYHVLMFDYRGFGRSTGRPTRAGTIRDGHAALDYVRTRADCRTLPVFVYGQSLGGAIAVVVAAERPEVRGVIAESTFGRYRGVAAAHLQRRVLWRPLAELLAAVTISAGHDPLDAVGRIAPRPILIITGEQDEICFPALGAELFAAAGEPKTLWQVPGRRHLALLEADYAGLTDRITTFLDDAGR